MLHQIIFTATLVFLSLWFYFQDRKYSSIFLRSAFFLSFAVFLASSLLDDANWSAKIFWLVRDAFFLAAASTVLSVFRKTTPVFLIGLIASIALVVTQLKREESKLASDGELLLVLQNTGTIKNLQTTFPELTFRKAFFPFDTSSDLNNWWIVDIAYFEFRNISSIKKQLAAFEQVLAVENNEKIQVEPLQSNKTSNTQKRFSVNDPGLDRAWGFEAMEVEKLYTFLKNNQIPAQKKARIAILDSGIDAKHEDLKANYVSTKLKYDTDTHGHGTHCAGIAASVTNNGLGIASYGLDNNFIEVTSIKVLLASGAGTQEMIIDGMIEAADSGADVISMSLGGYSNDQRQKAYEQAVAYCNKKGAIVVVAAGNSNSNARYFTPANVPGVITVSAVDERLRKAEFSNYITEIKMGVAAPGVNIYSTTPKNTYDTFSGTSMATPYVAGLIGVLKSLNPDLTTPQAYNILNNTGKPTQNTTATGKLIFPLQAIQAMD
jgi:thermitase